MLNGRIYNLLDIATVKPSELTDSAIAFTPLKGDIMTNKGSLHERFAFISSADSTEYEIGHFEQDKWSEGDFKVLATEEVSRIGSCLADSQNFLQYNISINQTNYNGYKCYTLHSHIETESQLYDVFFTALVDVKVKKGATILLYKPNAKADSTIIPRLASTIRMR